MGALLHLRTANYNKTLIGYKCDLLSSIVAAVDKTFLTTFNRRILDRPLNVSACHFDNFYLPKSYDTRIPEDKQVPTKQTYHPCI